MHSLCANILHADSLHHSTYAEMLAVSVQLNSILASATIHVQ